MEHDESDWPDDSILYYELLTGGIINSPDMAQRMSDLVLAKVEGMEEVVRAHPYEITDQGDVWHVKGRAEATGPEEGAGPWEVTIRKRDAAVLFFGRSLTVSPEMVERALRGP